MIFVYIQSNIPISVNIINTLYIKNEDALLSEKRFNMRFPSIKSIIKIRCHKTLSPKNPRAPENDFLASFNVVHIRYLVRTHDKYIIIAAIIKIKNTTSMNFELLNAVFATFCNPVSVRSIKGAP